MFYVFYRDHGGFGCIFNGGGLFMQKNQPILYIGCRYYLLVLTDSIASVPLMVQYIIPLFTWYPMI